MKKQILLLLITLIASAAFAQESPPPSQYLKSVNGQFYMDTRDSSIWQYMGSPYGWQKKVRLKDIPSLTVGATVTSTPPIGLSTPTAQALINGFYQSQPPTASLTGGISIELTAASTVTQPITYGYGKQTGTQNIASATIGGSTSGITQNAAGYSGSISETFAANTSATYTLLVTTVDSKTASASTTFSFLPKRYWGHCTGTTPTSTEILAAAGGGSNLAGARLGTFAVTASGPNYIFYITPVSQGSPTLRDASTNADVTSAFNITTISFTNASGYTQNYYQCVSQSATAGNYSFIIQ